MATGRGKPQADEWPCTLHSLGGLVPLAELHHWALPELGESEREK